MIGAMAYDRTKKDLRILVIDNYDSFTYNLVQQVLEITGKRPAVVRNDMIDDELLASHTHIIISPGPGVPKDAGQTMEVLEKLDPKQRVLGICLGFQAIAERFGGKLINLPKVKHGVQSDVTCTSHQLFVGIPQDIKVGRYHSWSVSPNDLPKELEVICRADDGCIMGIAHTEHPIYGFQFHPESVMTEYGNHMMYNFLSN